MLEKIRKLSKKEAIDICIFIQVGMVIASCMSYVYFGDFIENRSEDGQLIKFNGKLYQVIEIERELGMFNISNVTVNLIDLNTSKENLT